MKIHQCNLTTYCKSVLIIQNIKKRTIFTIATGRIGFAIRFVKTVLNFAAREIQLCSPCANPSSYHHKCTRKRIPQRYAIKRFVIRILETHSILTA